METGLRKPQKKSARFGEKACPGYWHTARSVRVVSSVSHAKSNLVPMDVLFAAIRLITQELRPWAGPKKQAVYDEIARVPSQAQRQIERRYKNWVRCRRASRRLPMPRVQREGRSGCGTRREAGGLTRDQLARLAWGGGQHDSQPETGRHRPTRQILMRLKSVPDLGIPSPVADPSGGARYPPAKKKASAASACNCWFAPEYDSIQMAQDMVQSLNGRRPR